MKLNEFLNYLSDHDASNDLAGDIFDVMTMKGLVDDAEGIADDVVFDFESFDLDWLLVGADA